MSTLSLFRRRDPWWEMDGPAARAKRRRERSSRASRSSPPIAAVVGAAFAWSIQVGLAAFLHARLGLG